MNLKLIFYFVVLIFDHGHALNSVEVQESSEDWTKVLNILSRENSVEFLKHLSFENISQQCSDHTQVFHKRITDNPIVGLTDGYWELKSIFSLINYFIITKSYCNIFIPVPTVFMLRVSQGVLLGFNISNIS